MQPLDNLLALALGVVGLLVGGAAVYWVVLLSRLGNSLSALNRRSPKLPRHAVEARKVDPRWDAESAYDKMVGSLFDDVQAAILEKDMETLEVLAQGPALLFLRGQALANLDRRAVLQGSVRLSWDGSSETLVVKLAVARCTKGWRRFYEEWRLQRQGQGWFVVGARAASLD